jgi:hypothetical protein
MLMDNDADSEEPARNQTREERIERAILSEAAIIATRSRLSTLLEQYPRRWPAVKNGPFTRDNDHNPEVLEDCRRCKGTGEIELEGAEPVVLSMSIINGVRRVNSRIPKVQCADCLGFGISGQVVKLFQNDWPTIEATTTSNGWLGCPRCYTKFSVLHFSTWTGMRHKNCGQKLRITILAFFDDGPPPPPPLPREHHHQFVHKALLERAFSDPKYFTHEAATNTLITNKLVEFWKEHGRTLSGIERMRPSLLSAATRRDGNAVLIDITLPPAINAGEAILVGLVFESPKLFLLSSRAPVLLIFLTMEKGNTGEPDLIKLWSADGSSKLIPLVPEKDDEILAKVREHGLTSVVPQLKSRFPTTTSR